MKTSIGSKSFLILCALNFAFVFLSMKDNLYKRTFYNEQSLMYFADSFKNYIIQQRTKNIVLAMLINNIEFSIFYLAKRYCFVVNIASTKFY